MVKRLVVGVSSAPLAVRILDSVLANPYTGRGPLSRHLPASDLSFLFDIVRNQVSLVAVEIDHRIRYVSPVLHYPQIWVGTPLSKYYQEFRHRKISYLNMSEHIIRLTVMVRPRAAAETLCHSSNTLLH